MSLPIDVAEKLRQRGIEPTLVESALAQPDHTYIYPDGSKRLSFRTAANRVLTLVIRDIGDDTHLSTVYFMDDRSHVLMLNLLRARALIAHDPGAAVLFGVAAFEAYCADVFSDLGDFEKYLLKKRRVNMQNADEVREIFQLRFKVDIASNHLAWTTLKSVIRWRHVLAHRAGLDREGKIVRITAADAELGMRAIGTILSMLKAATDAGSRTP